MVKSDKYKAWLDTSTILLFEAGAETLPPKTPIHVEFFANVNRQRDLDNLIKPTLDMLQYAGILPDDRWVDIIVAYRADYLAKDKMLLRAEVIDYS